MEAKALRLKPDEKIIASLEKLYRDMNLSSAFILTCVGSVRGAILRFATNPHTGREEIKHFDENLEICSLNGTISRDGIHLHAVFGRIDGSTIGGHVMGDLTVQTTAEIVLASLPGVNFTRQFSPETGFKELHITP